MDRLLRFESVVAICALLISAISGAASVYQTRIIRDQYAATIWPYLSIDSRVTNARKIEIALTNDGLGPALIRSAALSLDGKHVASWNEYASMIARDLPKASKVVLHTASDVNASTTIRPGETQPLLIAEFPRGQLLSILAHHPATLSFCYCSINDTCWTKSAVQNRTAVTVPSRVAACPVDKGIASSPY